jgi:hypothetical protein
MGKFKPGAMGVVRGLIGTIVASKWKDIHVVKGRPAKSNKAATLQQADQRMRFGVVTALLKRITALIGEGYQKAGKNQTAMNEAISYHLKNAIIGTYPDYKLDITKLKISKGDKSSLDSAWQPKLIASAGAVVTVSWELFKYSSKDSSGTDTITILFYNVEKDKFIMLPYVALRSELNIAEQLPESYVGNTFHCYVYMVSRDKKKLSASQYIGQVKVLA